MRRQRWTFVKGFIPTSPYSKALKHYSLWDHKAEETTPSQPAQPAKAPKEPPPPKETPPKEPEQEATQTPPVEPSPPVPPIPPPTPPEEPESIEHEIENYTEEPEEPPEAHDEDHEEAHEQPTQQVGLKLDSVDRSFIQEIKSTPEDTTPRLVWADYLEEKGESDYADAIRLSVRSWQVHGEISQTALLYRRLTQLENEHQEWFQPWGMLPRNGWPTYWRYSELDHLGMAQFDRGTLRLTGTATHLQRVLADPSAQRSLPLVEAVTLHARHPAQLYDLFYETEWLRGISDLNIGENNLGTPEGAAHIVEALTTTENAHNLRLLTLTDDYLTAREARMIAESPHLEGLQVLEMGNGELNPDEGSNDIGEEGAMALAESPYLRNITRLDLRGMGLPLRARRALQRRFGDAVLLD